MDHKDSTSPCRCQTAEGGLSRRGFMTAVGAGAVGLAATAGNRQAAAAPTPVSTSEDAVRVRLRVNGRDRELLVEPRWSLLYVLRERFGLTGSKAGCERGECGACTVLINGIPRYACLTLAVEAQGYDVTTIEGLLDGEELGPTQLAFAEEDAFQCGYCTPGQIMAVEGLVRTNPDPSEQQIRRAVAGNLCRCGAYPHIFKAARRAARMRRGGE